MNRPRQNKRCHQSDSRKNSFLRGVKIEKATLYVKAILWTGDFMDSDRSQNLHKAVYIDVAVDEAARD